jgi:DNA invertase Pin-like site-specific DNA recombinase
VKLGMEKAKAKGSHIGRPKVPSRHGFGNRYGDILERLDSGLISRRKAARELKIGYATLKRLLDGHYEAE